MPKGFTEQPATDLAAQGIDLATRIGPDLARALHQKGYATLTAVQESVLNPELEGRDLRISSQTGSGKTLAIGFALRSVLEGGGPASRPEQGVAKPRALVIVPTRELAKQVETELGWLYARQSVRIVSVTGGSSYRDEHRALASGPAIVVGTPGRLLDHLKRGAIQTEALGAVALDEADRMLDLGFRDDLEAILALTPEDRQTHLVSATFPKELLRLADRFQRDPAIVQGTPLGTANTDIDHVVHVVPARERVSALINLLLYHELEQTLVFARTRADVAAVTGELQQAGFMVASLSGEMEQPARNRALSAFKRGEVRVLVATDVAARGIDVQDISRVVHLDPPTDADTYTHRSGRTGRAGRKGISAMLVPTVAMNRISSLLQRAQVRFRIEPVPTAEMIRRAQDEKLLLDLTKESEVPVPKRVEQQVAQILDRGLAERALTRLLVRTQTAAGEPREISPVKFTREGVSPNPPKARGGNAQSRDPSNWVTFQVSWGEAHGADARKVVAMLCRRGNIRGGDIGSIRVGRTSTSVEVAARVARDFARAAAEPDPRDPRVRVSLLQASSSESPPSGARFAAQRRSPGPPSHPSRAASANDHQPRRSPEPNRKSKAGGPSKPEPQPKAKAHRAKVAPKGRKA